MQTKNTEAVVGCLKRAGLVAYINTRQTKRLGFSVHQFSGSEVGVVGYGMTDEEWGRAMSALEVSGHVFVYRSDEGRGARVR